MKNKIIWFTLASIALFFWSVHSISIRYMINELWMSSMSVLFLRYFVWTIFLTFFMLIIVKKKEIKNVFRWKNNILKNKNFWFTSLSLITASILLHLSLKYTSASIWMILLTMSPTLVVLYTMMFFKEKLNKYISIRKIFFTVLITSIGSALLINDYSFVKEDGSNYKMIWDLFAAIATIARSLFNIYIVELRKDYKNYNWLLITTLYLGVWAIISLPIWIYFFNTILPLTIEKSLLILLVWAWSIWIAYFTRFLSSKYLNSIILSILWNILWVTTIISEYIIYWRTNPMTINLVIWGLMIIFSTIYITHLTNKK